MTVVPLVVSAVRDDRGDQIIAVRYSYDAARKLPNRKGRIEMTRALLREALDRLESGEAVDVGFSEDVLRRVRTDRLQVLNREKNGEKTCENPLIREKLTRTGEREAKRAGL